MVALTTQRDFRAVQRLPFCYVCGISFAGIHKTNRDHVPPSCVFAEDDRQPLILRAHPECNSSHKLLDEKIGQLVGLRRYSAPSDPNNFRLTFTMFSDHELVAVTNVEVDEAIWLWIRGFHAALYRVPIRPWERSGALQTPFPSAQMENGGPNLDRMKPHHYAIVQTIKDNRARGTIDRIENNNGKMRYECVWCQADNDGPWMCFFALDIYDWKDLGAVEKLGARGCAGFYTYKGGMLPQGATCEVRSQIAAPNLDPVDPFGR